VIVLKILKKLKSGLIINDSFASGSVTAPLKSNANLTFTATGVDINRGSIILDTFSFATLVIQVFNEFNPTNETDMGGLSVNRGSDVRELFEYYNPAESGTVPYVKLVKNGDVYVGYGSEDGLTWSNKGQVYFPYADSVGLTVVGNSPYTVKNYSAYLGNLVTLYGVTAPWHVEFYDTNSVLQASKNITSDRVSIELPYYPFSGTCKVLDELNNVLLEYTLTDVWGGDEYAYGTDVDLLTYPDRQPLMLTQYQHLGKLADNVLETMFVARNNSDSDSSVTIQIPEFSPYKDWVYLAADNGLTPSTYDKTVYLVIPANGEVFFWLKISKPFDGDTFIDYTKTECMFYLEVV
jgi:hypothetical protein